MLGYHSMRRLINSPTQVCVVNLRIFIDKEGESVILLQVWMQRLFTEVLMGMRLSKSLRSFWYLVKRSLWMEVGKDHKSQNCWALTEQMFVQLWMKRSQVAKLFGFDRADVCAAVDEKITSHKIVWL